MANSAEVAARSDRPKRIQAVVVVLPLPVVLGAVADGDGEACEGRATLGVAKLGIVGDVSD